MMARRRILTGTMLGAVALGRQALAKRRRKPSWPIRFVVGFSAGGVSDTAVKLVSGR